jgi:hypothetical protein
MKNVLSRRPPKFRGGTNANGVDASRDYDGGYVNRDNLPILRRFPAFLPLSVHKERMKATEPGRYCP